MTDINKQKFLAELGKLLTFMYEEDRLDALAVYEEMFDSCVDEQQLIHHLISPTRQAVVLARTYNAKERMLSVQSQSRRDDLYGDYEEIPAFILAIDDIKNEVPHLFSARPLLDESQFSLFEEENFEEAPVEQEAPEAIEGQITLSLSEEEGRESEDGAETFDVEETTEVPGTAESSESLEVEDYIEVVEETIPTVYSELEDPQYRFGSPRRRNEVVIEDERLQDLASHHKPHRENVRRKRIIPLLILYVIFAVPISILVVALLLIPTVLSLVLSLGFVAAGVSTLGCAFGSFAIFADILVVLGCSLVLLALGLFFFWLFVWFIGGAIAGFVNGAIKLGDRFSSKEVSA